jgi:exodeoxyribonuclease VII small subunit
MPPKSKTKPQAAPETLSFEDAFQELDDLVRQLEDSNLTLDESLALYERGQALAARCQSLLETAELNVQQLAPRAGGGFDLEPFEPGDPAA